MKKGRVNVVVDGQWGSTGKGKLAAYLAQSGVEVSICDFQTNAGHTVVLDSGEKFVFQQLPSAAAVNEDVELMIGPASTITTSKLIEEIEMTNCQDRLMIHPNASIVTDACRDYEKEHLKRISSTLKGCGAATGMKAMRHPSVVRAVDEPSLARFIGDTTESVHKWLRSGAVVLAEGAQGFDLSLNHGYEYPYVTSRDVTTASILSNAGVPPQLMGDVYGCVRTYPIRVGNHVEEGRLLGHSGPHYPDQMEIDWSDLQTRSGATTAILERTTVTGKVRRVFTFSMRQFSRFLRVCMPTHIFVNFINHVSVADAGARSYSQLSTASREFIAMIDGACVGMDGYAGVDRPCVSHVGTGPAMSDMVEVL